jgi:hypothetical protein
MGLQEQDDLLARTSVWSIVLGVVALVCGIVGLFTGNTYGTALWIGLVAMIVNCFIITYQGEIAGGLIVSLLKGGLMLSSVVVIIILIGKNAAVLCTGITTIVVELVIYLWVKGYKKHILATFGALFVISLIASAIIYTIDEKGWSPRFWIILGVIIVIAIGFYIRARNEKLRKMMEEELELEIEEENRRRHAEERRKEINLLVPQTSEYDKVYLIGGEKRRDFQAINGVKDDLEVVYYRSGQINKRQYYKNGALTGEATTYYPDGQVYIVAHYLNNFLNGQYTIYNHDGSILETREFRNGERAA